MLLKYTIKNFVSPALRHQIINALDISEKTYYSKINAKIGEKQGFEVCELLKISTILNRSFMELITTEAQKHYKNEN